MDGEDEDPFEIHTQLLSLLSQNLSARMIQKIAQFAYDAKAHHVSIFQSLLDQMKILNPMKRLNLLYVIDSFVKQSSKYEFEGYNDLILSHLKEIIDLVVDIVRVDGKVVKKPDKHGLANINGLKKVLALWRAKEFVSKDRLERVTRFLDSLFDTPSGVLSKESVWRRMEDDRDRQKKSREESWVVNDTYESEFDAALAKSQLFSLKDLDMFESLKAKYDTSKAEYKS